MTLPIRNLRIRLPQGQLFWREVGAGPTVVFLHGAWGDGSQWVPLMNALSDRAHCLAPDLLGFGESEHHEGTYSIALETECLSDYLDTLRLREVYIVAHSVGAWVAANLALTDGHRVRGLVLINPEGVEVSGHRYPWRRSRWWVGRFPFFRWLLWAWRPFVWTLGQQTRWRSLRLYQRMLRQSPAACRLLFQRRWAELQAECLSDRTDWIKVPTRIIQTAEVSATQAAMNQTYASAPHAKLEVLDAIADHQLYANDLSQEDVLELAELIMAVMAAAQSPSNLPPS
jgi:pimeloyl-ACP methyl ester carboxylesterase